MNLVAIVLRVFLVVSAPVLSVLAFRIYRKTQGGSRGWLFMAVSFGSLGVWAVSQLIFTFLLDSFEARTVMTILMFIPLSLFAPLSAIRLCNDMKCRLPSCMKERNVIMIFIVFFGALAGYNAMTSSNFMGSLASVSVLSNIPMFIIAWMGYGNIAKATKKRMWSWLAWGCIVTMIGSFMIVSTYTDCCGIGSPLNGQEECSTWSYDYSPAIPLPCVGWALPVMSNSAAVVFMGIIMLTYAVEKLRRAMSV